VHAVLHTLGMGFLPGTRNVWTLLLQSVNEPFALSGCVHVFLLGCASVEAGSLLQAWAPAVGLQHLRGAWGAEAGERALVHVPGHKGSCAANHAAALLRTVTCGRCCDTCLSVCVLP